MNDENSSLRPLSEETLTRAPMPECHGILQTARELQRPCLVVGDFNWKEAYCAPAAAAGASLLPVISTVMGSLAAPSRGLVLGDLFRDVTSVATCLPGIPHHKAVCYTGSWCPQLQAFPERRYHRCAVYAWGPRLVAKPLHVPPAARGSINFARMPLRFQGLVHGPFALTYPPTPTLRPRSWWSSGSRSGPRTFLRRRVVGTLSVSELVSRPVHRRPLLCRLLMTSSSPP